MTPAVRDAQELWEQSLRAAERSWIPLVPAHARATNGVTLTALPDHSLLASGPNPVLTSYEITVTTPAQGITGLRLETLPDRSLPRSGPGRDAYGHFRVTGIDVEIAAAATAPGAKGQAVAFRTIKVDDSAYPFEPADLLSAGSGPANRKGGSWAINAMRDRDAERVPRHAVLAAQTPFGFSGGTRITVRIDHLDGTIGQGIGRLRLSVTTAPDPLVGSELAARLRPILAQPASERSPAHAEELAAFFRSTAPSLQPTRDALTAARKALADLQIPSTLVMKERPSFERPSYEVRERGSFTARGDRVYARTPDALHPMRDDLPANRLGLARWLVDDKNPLVARVAVNRFWEQIFGRGIVETSEDFGAQGALPTHPELLDWLATEFVAGKWSQKAILRTIVRSATYRQSSAVSAALEERDPYNRLLARGPRVRMEAEMVRDVGARRERPPQPEDARTERLPDATAGHLEHALQLRQVGDERRRGPLPAQPVYLLATHVTVSQLHDVRRHEPRVLPGAARPHEHAAAGPDAPQRSRVLRDRPRARAPHAAGSRRGRRAPVRAPLSASSSYCRARPAQTS